MSLHSWPASSYVRHYPSTTPKPNQPILLEGALNEPLNFQIALRSDEPRQNVRVEVDAPSGWNVRTRRVGYVPLAHHNQPVPDSDLDVDGRHKTPGYVPDPLFNENTLLLPPNETHAFWFSAKPGRNVTQGKRNIKIRIIPDNGKPKTHSIAVKTHPINLAPRKKFNVTNWFYIDSLMDWYKTNDFDNNFWNILEAYLRNMAEHEQDTVYVPVFTPPLDGVKRPTQLLRVQQKDRHQWRFDWRDVRRYIRLAKTCGITHFEWSHPFTQWGVKHAIRIYHDQDKNEKLLWPPTTSTTSTIYKAFLKQYLGELRKFLEEERIFNKSFFHVSDEPHGEEHLENYKRARSLLRELAPWMKVMDALSEITFARNNLTDMPVPSVKTALDFINENINCWCYYCCAPRGAYIQRLLDTPLPKIAMHGFLLYRWPFKGFLHWGYNYWYISSTRTLIDPYTVQDGGGWKRNWAYGDTFMVYPGPNGPVDSIRWEVFADALRDYRLLQTLNIPRNDKILKPIKAFDDFPKTETWRNKARALLLNSKTRKLG